MPVDDGYGRRVGDTDMVGLDAHEFSVLLVRVLHALIPPALARLQQQPQGRELRGERAGDISDRGVRGVVWDDVEEEESDRDGVRREEEVDHGHFCLSQEPAGRMRAWQDRHS